MLLWSFKLLKFDIILIMHHDVMFYIHHASCYDISSYISFYLISENGFQHIIPNFNKKNQLVGENFIDWKRNLIIVLTAKKFKYLLTEACPPKPTGQCMLE
jgi:hypothetical protein